MQYKSNNKLDKFTNSLSKRQVSFIFADMKSDNSLININTDKFYLLNLLENNEIDEGHIQYLENRINQGMIGNENFDWIGDDLRKQIWIYSMIAQFYFQDPAYPQTNFNPIDFLLPDFYEDILLRFDLLENLIKSSSSNIANFVVKPNNSNIHDTTTSNSNFPKREDKSVLIPPTPPVPDYSHNFTYVESSSTYPYSFIFIQPSKQATENTVVQPNANARRPIIKVASSTPISKVDGYLSLQSKKNFIRKLQNTYSTIILDDNTSWLNKNNEEQILWARDNLRKNNSLIMPIGFIPTSLLDIYA